MSATALAIPAMRAASSIKRRVYDRTLWRANRNGRRHIGAAVELGSMDERTVRALVAALCWTAGVILLRWSLYRIFNRYESRLSDADAGTTARRRTTFNLLVQIVVAVVVLIGIWSVLSFFPSTAALGRALLASSAVTAPGEGHATWSPNFTSNNGFILHFGPDGYFGGVGGLSFTISDINAVTPVPEAATWLSMILGFGIVGAAMRRRSTLRSAVAIV